MARLGQLVLELEQSDVGESADMIAEIFREVHTLKGSAAVVGFEDVGRYAHGVEDKLGLLRSGCSHSDYGRSSMRCWWRSIDLGSMIWESVGGQDVDENANSAALASSRCSVRADGRARRSTVRRRSLGTVADAATRCDAADARRGPNRCPTSLDTVSTDPTDQATQATPRQRGTASGTVMVPVERLDELVRMVGEAAAAHLRVGRDVHGAHRRRGRQPARSSRSSRELLNRLQERAMRTRMVPVSTITDSLQRAVRDAARSLGKDVRWEVRGEDTELDRGVLHQLADSLLHLVRNAVDHGIDSPEQRAAAGKPAQAVVRLHAMQLGSEVIIAVSDDGGGVDLERVRAQAMRMGIAVDDLDDDETLQLIFASGFSTAKFVSDISGRGRRPRCSPVECRGRQGPGGGPLHARRGQRVPNRRPDHACRAALPARRGGRTAIRAAPAPRRAWPSRKRPRPCFTPRGGSRSSSMAGRFRSAIWPRCSAFRRRASAPART